MRFWHLTKRWCCKSPGYCGLFTVQQIGKWSVHGSTGEFFVTGPNFSVRKKAFKTEREAMDWVEAKLKLKNEKPRERMYVVAANRGKQNAGIWIQVEAANSPAGTPPVMKLERGQIIIIEQQ